MEICQVIDYNVEDARYSSPCEIGGLALWLDATDGFTLLNKDGGYCSGINNEPIDTWLDKSGNELNGKARTVSNIDTFRPKLRTNFFNKKNVIEFNRFVGQGFFGDYPFEGYAATSFIVWKAGEIDGAFEKILSFDNLPKSPDLVSRDHIVAYNYPSNAVTAYGTQEEGSSFPFYTQGRSWSVTSVSWIDRFQNNVFINGQSSATAFISGPLPVADDAGKYAVGCESVRSNTLFGTAYFNGYVGEVIIYKRILPDVERQLIEKYLLFKWGFSS